jgi:hypothetical protein
LKIFKDGIILSLQNKFGIKPDLKIETPASQGDTFVPEKVTDQMSHEKQKISIWNRKAILFVKMESFGNSKYNQGVIEAFYDCNTSSPQGNKKSGDILHKHKDPSGLIEPKGEWRRKSN